MLSRSNVEAREAERAMIAAAMERFLAEGNQVTHVAPGCTGEKIAGPQPLLINVPGKPKAKPRRVQQPRERNRAEETRESIKKANAARIEMHRRERELMAVKVAMHAGLGDGIGKVAREFGVTQNYLRRIAKEHNITFTNGRKAQ